MGPRRANRNYTYSKITHKLTRGKELMIDRT
jgi:hypothetical protein